jgi:all-trans-retinol 13,14-reductase
LDPGQPFRQLLTYLGVYSEDLFIPLEADGFDVFHFPNRTVQFPKGYEALTETLSSHFPKEREAIRTFLKQTNDAVQHFPTYTFKGEFGQTFPVELLERSLHEQVNRLTKNPELQSVLYGHCALHGVAPKDVPFGLHSLVLDSLVLGPYGLRHGGDALTNAFVRVIQSQGGQVLTKQKVTKLELGDRQVKAAITEKGERFEAEWIISGIHPKLTLGMIEDNQGFTPAFRDRVNKMEESIGFFGIYADCENRPDLDRRRNYYFFRESDPESTWIPPTEFSPPTAAFCAFAARGDAKPDTIPLNLHSASPMSWFEPWRDTRYGKRPEEYAALKNRVAEQVFDLVGLFKPGFGGSVKRYVTSSPLTNLHFNGSADGSAHGIYHSIQNTGVRSLGPRTKVLNLLLTGQNSLFPGLLGAAVSGLRTSGHIIGMKPILSELGNIS